MTKEYAALVGGVDAAIMIAAAVQIQSLSQRQARTRAVATPQPAASVWGSISRMIIVMGFSSGCIGLVLWWSATGSRSASPSTAFTALLGTFTALVLLAVDVILTVPRSTRQDENTETG
ncbi:hypothetical protein ACFWB2_31980 [Streptomyces virginiae]|uniref:hypothetical protein n=1 Tax=Streptomyces virginiae TaxID=1961 RepID=UPI0036813055